MAVREDELPHDNPQLVRRHETRVGDRRRYPLYRTAPFSHRGGRPARKRGFHDDESRHADCLQEVGNVDLVRCLLHPHPRRRRNSRSESSGVLFRQFAVGEAKPNGCDVQGNQLPLRFGQRPHRRHDAGSRKHLIHVGSRCPRISQHQPCHALGPAGCVSDSGLRATKMAKQRKALESQALDNSFKV